MIAQTKKQKAITLVELLVVIVIMVMLVAVVLPLAQPAPEKRAVREAARQISTIFSSARSQAVATGKPHGVMLIPSAGNASRCFQLAITRSGSIYTGDGLGWIVRTHNIQPTPVAANDPYDPNDEFRGLLEFVSPDGTVWDHDDLAIWNLFDHDDVNVQESVSLKLNYRGRQLDGYLGKRLPSDTNRQFYVSLPTATGPVGADSPTNGLPFQLQLPPRKTLAAPLELPVGSYIDLLVSGDGVANTIAGTTNPTLMFDTQGNLDNRSTAFLLVAADAKPEFSDAASFLNNLVVGRPSIWVSISKGRVSTTDNVGIIADTDNFTVSYEGNVTTYPNKPAFISGAIDTCRGSARSGPALGGR
jgi:type II secretory pathway pseudopilin PulG